MANLYQNILSIVGAPIPLMALPEKAELIKGDRFDGWEVPYNIKSDWATIFRVFGLWQSSNGICKEGVTINASFGAIRQLQMARPALVGDYVVAPNGFKRQVATAQNTFNSRSGSWEVWLEYGKPPKPLQVEEQTFEYIETLHTTLTTMGEENLKLLDDFFVKVLPLCTAAGSPIVTKPAEATWLPLKEAYKNTLEKKMQEVEDSKWRM